jgi:uncharacterized protein (DUF697 family)
MSTKVITADAVEAAVPEVETNEAKAMKITKRYALWSMGGGLIPVVGLDIIAIIAAQLKMLCEMSKLYGVEFKENRAKSIVTSLIGSLGIVPIGTGILFSLIKIIPLVGPLAATVALPVSAGAITYATGKIFVTHFESGGTFLNFNPGKMKEAYRRMFEEGKAVMTEASAKTAK